MNNWTAAFLFIGGLFVLIWLIGGPPMHPPLTGGSCVEVLNRMQKEIKAGKDLTPAERIDLEDCGKP